METIRTIQRIKQEDMSIKGTVAGASQWKEGGGKERVLRGEQDWSILCEYMKIAPWNLLDTV